MLHEVIDRFPLPLYLVAGNHDDPGRWWTRSEARNFLGGAHGAHYAVDHPAFTVVVLNSEVLPASWPGTFTVRSSAPSRAPSSPSTRAPISKVDSR